MPTHASVGDAAVRPFEREVWASRCIAIRSGGYLDGFSHVGQVPMFWMKQLAPARRAYSQRRGKFSG